MTKTTEVIDKVLEGLEGSYTSGRKPTINHIGSGPLPSRETIITILEILREILYPGYFGNQNLDFSSVRYHIGSLLHTLGELLTDQICRSLTITTHRSETLSAMEFHQVQVEADQLCAQFMEMLPTIREALRMDVQAAYDGDPAAKSYDEIIYSYPGITAITVYRIAHELHLLKVPLIPRIMTEWAHCETGIDIHPGAVIGHSFFIDHGAGVVIGETTIIGNQVKIYQGVTLGALSFPKDANGNIIRDRKRHPTIEDEVVIYAGATVLGGDTVIGKGSTIGGNVWLTESVEPGARVIISKPDLQIRVKPAS